MDANKIRRIAGGLAIGVVLLAGVPAFSGSRAGTIEHASLIPGVAYAGEVPVEWSWSGGTKVDSRDDVRVLVRNGAQAWQVITETSIRDGVVTWATATQDAEGVPIYDDGVYRVRVSVIGVHPKDTLHDVIVDNTSPLANITSPTTSQLIIDGESAPVAVVAGKATLSANAIDNLSGVAGITWTLGEEEIGTEQTFEYDFSDNPGQHTLSLTAVDYAGNETTDSIDLLALPGPSFLIDGGGVPELPDTGEEPTLPEPPTGEDPTLPELPDPTGDLPPVPDPEDPGDPGLPPAPSPEDPGDPTGGLPTVPEGIPTP